MAELYNAIIIPLLFGLLLVAVVINILVLWQMERTWRIFSIAILFTSLTWLYLVVALKLPATWREVGRIGFALGLLGSNYFRAHDLISFLRKKGAIHHNERKTLVTIATEKEDVVLAGFTSPNDIFDEKVTDVHIPEPVNKVLTDDRREEKSVI